MPNPDEMVLHRELRELEGRVEQMCARPDAIAYERIELSARVQEARMQLQILRAEVERTGKPDVARQRKLTEEITAAEEVLRLRQWDVEIAGARQAAHSMLSLVPEFVAQNVDALAQETIEFSFAARDEFVAQAQRAIEAWQALQEAAPMWDVIVPHLPGGPTANVIRRRDPSVADAMSQLQQLLAHEVDLPLPHSLVAPPVAA